MHCILHTPKILGHQQVELLEIRSQFRGCIPNLQRQRYAFIQWRSLMRELPSQQSFTIVM